MIGNDCIRQDQIFSEDIEYKRLKSQKKKSVSIMKLDKRDLVSSNF